MCNDKEDKIQDRLWRAFNTSILEQELALQTNPLWWGELIGISTVARRRPSLSIDDSYFVGGRSHLLSDPSRLVHILSRTNGDARYRSILYSTIQRWWAHFNVGWGWTHASALPAQSFAGEAVYHDRAAGPANDSTKSRDSQPLQPNDR